MLQKSILIKPAIGIYWARAMILLYFMLAALAIFNQAYLAISALVICSPILIIAEKLGQSLEIHEAHLIRQGPLTGRVIIPWNNIASLTLTHSKHDYRMVEIIWPKRRFGFQSNYSFSVRQKFAKVGLIALIEMAEYHQIKIRTTKLYDNVQNWKRWTMHG